MDTPNSQRIYHWIEVRELILARVKSFEPATVKDERAWQKYMHLLVTLRRATLYLLHLINNHRRSAFNNVRNDKPSPCILWEGRDYLVKIWYVSYYPDSRMAVVATVCVVQFIALGGTFQGTISPSRWTGSVPCAHSLWIRISSTICNSTCHHQRSTQCLRLVWHHGLLLPGPSDGFRSANKYPSSGSRVPAAVLAQVSAGFPLPYTRFERCLEHRPTEHKSYFSVEGEMPILNCCHAASSRQGDLDCWGGALDCIAIGASVPSPYNAPFRCGDVESCR